MGEVCKSCGFAHAKVSKNLFCINCGSVIDTKDFKNQDLLLSTEREIKEFIGLADRKHKQLMKESPIPGLQGLFDKLAGIRGFLDAFLEQESKSQDLGEDEQERHIERLKKFLDDCDALASRDTNFQIAVAGTIKAGKSTLINAILKGQYASVSVTPETAVLTKFGYGERDEITTSFYDEKEWEEFWASASKAKGVFMKEFEERGGAAERSKWVGREPITEPLSVETLKKYTSSKSASHYYAKEVRINLRDFPYGRNVVLVDTPGLNDPVGYRSDVSRRYIRQANAVLLCVSAEKLENTTLDTIFRIFDNTGGHPEKVYVLGTKYENLNQPFEDWEEQKKEWTKYLSSNRDDDRVQFSNHLADKNIIPVSGHIASLVDLHEKKEISGEEVRQLENTSFKLYRDPKFENHLDRLREFSAVEYVCERVKDDLLNNVEKEIVSDMEASYEALRKEIGGYFEEMAEGLQDTLKRASRGADEIKESLKEKEQELVKLEDEKRELEKFMGEFRDSTKNLVDGLDKAIDEMISKAN